MFDNSAHIYDALYSFKDYASESAKIHTLIQERNPGANTLLDVACGTGAHLEHLARHYEVEGLDLDDSMLAIARDRLPNVPLHSSDMTTFDLGKTYGAVTCLFSSVGYVETEENLMRATAAIARHLEPGAGSKTASRSSISIT